MSKRTSYEQRYKIKQLVEKGYTKKEISKQMKMPISTVKKWIRRSKQEELNSKMGRPKSGVLSSFPISLIEKIKKMREDKPGWGGIMIHVELSIMKEYSGTKLPSPSSINRYLREQGLVRKYEKHSDLVAIQVIKSKRPHHVWQMDAQGNEEVDSLGSIAPIQIKDTFSHIYIQSYPYQMASKRHQATTEHYQQVLRLSWCEWGMNQALQVDHESIFYDNGNPSPFPTRFHLWLIGMNIHLGFTPKGRPQKQGMVERSHQTMFSQTLKGQSYSCWKDLYKEMNRKRKILNEHYPCSTLGGRSPLKVFPNARHSGKAYSPELEIQLFDVKRIQSYLAKGVWFRTVGSSKTISLGGHVYYLAKAISGQQVRIIFNNRKKN